MNRVGEANDRRVVPVTDSSLHEHLDGLAYDEWANAGEAGNTWGDYINGYGIESVGI